jgi:hypothetical protein
MQFAFSRNTLEINFIQVRTVHAEKYLRKKMIRGRKKHKDFSIHFFMTSERAFHFVGNQPFAMMTFWWDQDIDVDEYRKL